MSIRINPRSSARRALLALLIASTAATAVVPAFAEGNTATTTSPPSFESSQEAPQSENSLPENAETATINRPGVVQTSQQPTQR